MHVSIPPEATLAPDPPTPWLALAGVIATVSIFAIAQGLGYPLMSFILERRGISASMIGLSAAMTPLGLIAGSPFIPVLVRRLGARPLAVGCALLAAASLALIGWTQDPVAWFPLRFAIGLAIGPLFVLSEVWIIELAPRHRRGRIIGIYTAAISTGFAAGPLALVLVGTRGWAPFLVGIGAFLVAAAWLIVVLRRLPTIGAGREKASVRGFLPRAPTLLLAVFVTAAFEQAVLSLLPVYGVSYGMRATGVSALLVVLIAGNILLQLPLGLAAERLGARSVLIYCALATALLCPLLPLAIGTPFVWPHVFLWGAASFGIYTLALIELGERFSGSMLVAANAAFALLWGFGGIAGPPGAGAVIDMVGVQGLPFTMMLLYLGLAAVRIARR